MGAAAAGGCRAMVAIDRHPAIGARCWSGRRLATRRERRCGAVTAPPAWKPARGISGRFGRPLIDRDQVSACPGSRNVEQTVTYGARHGPRNLDLEGLESNVTYPTRRRQDLSTGGPAGRGWSAPATILVTGRRPSSRPPTPTPGGTHVGLDADRGGAGERQDAGLRPGSRASGSELSGSPGPTWPSLLHPHTCSSSVETSMRNWTWTMFVVAVEATERRRAALLVTCCPSATRPCWPRWPTR